MGSDETTTLDLGIGPEMEEGLEMLSKLEGITDISAMDGPLLTFFGRLVTTLDGFGTITRVDVFACVRGWYLFFVPQERENWAAAGTDLEGAVADIPDAACAAEVRSSLHRSGVIANDAGAD
ncbi:MAG: hypothetical protein CL878_12905 [Dehalococcoidia bacterium]|nr:hypothetical protein [Dehalococcoidia bacterium]